MPISALRDRLEQGLLEFAWNEWAQLGVLSEVSRPSTWAQDLEPLLVLSLDVARADPRLFDEILDWLVHNEALLSVRRLRTVARDSPEPTLTEAMLAWIAQHRPKARFSGQHHRELPGATTRLFFDEDFPIRKPDAAFLEHGWLRPEAMPTGKAQEPVLTRPIALGLRLRRMYGPGARAEAMRILLCSDAKELTATAITRSATYTKGNVLEALRGLEDARVVSVDRVGREAHYAVNDHDWATLLRVERPFPTHVAWVQLLGGLGAILAWVRGQAGQEASDYMLGSAARQLLKAVGPDLRWAGIAVEDGPPSSAMDELSAVIGRCLMLLGVE